MNRVKKVLLILSSLLLVTFCLVGCSNGAKFLTDDEMLDESTIYGTLTIQGKLINSGAPLGFEFELYYNKAPMAVSSFISLSKSGFYNDTIIHRIKTDGGLIELGGYEMGENNLIRKNLDYTFAGEFEKNGWKKNDIKHEQGTLTMLHSYYADNNVGSIFGIVVGKNSKLDGNQTAFGRITSNTNKLDGELYRVPTTNIGSFGFVPESEIKIVSIEINTEKEFNTIIKNTK